ncbi:hypothetical protein L7F22_058447 [Adiantum nelumboides]|nr:hypothetical protein [Adiantum nelumboides]
MVRCPAYSALRVQFGMEDTLQQCIARSDQKDDVYAKSCMPISEGEHPRSVVEDDLLLLTNVNEPTTFSQLQIQNEINLIFQLGVPSAAAVALAFLACSRAWAGPEIASVQDAASWWGDLDDIKSGFVSAFLLIFFSEIGDKTFFIAAVLASRKSNIAVFTGTFGALVAMTFISVFLGRTFHYIDGILPFSLGENDLPLDDLAAVVLLVYFGATTLLEAASMEGSKAQEEQQEAELAIAGLGGNGKGSAVTNTTLATFGLVFVAEWGDKSFFSTVGENCNLPLSSSTLICKYFTEAGAFCTICMACR